MKKKTRFYELGITFSRELLPHCNDICPLTHFIFFLLQTIFGRVRLFFHKHLCCWVIPNRVSCWHETMVACQASISSLYSDERLEEFSKQKNKDALKLEAEKDTVKTREGKSAEEIAMDNVLDVDSFDGAVS